MGVWWDGKETNGRSFGFTANGIQRSKFILNGNLSFRL